MRLFRPTLTSPPLLLFIAGWMVAGQVPLGSPVFGQTLDRFGGNTAIQSHATGFFRVESFGERWLFVTPEGHGYAALGANHVGRYLNEQADQMGLMARFDHDRGRAAAYLIEQMRAMGLNAGEAYAPLAPELQTQLPWVANFRFPTKSKFAFDVFDPVFQARLRRSVIDQCAPIRDDPMVLGIAFADLPVWDRWWRSLAYRGRRRPYPRHRSRSRRLRWSGDRPAR